MYVHNCIFLCPLTVLAVHDRQLRGRLAHRDDVAADDADRRGDRHLRRAPHPRPLLLPLDDQALQPRRQDRLAVGPRRRHTLAANVLQALLNMQASPCGCMHFTGNHPQDVHFLGEV